MLCKFFFTKYLSYNIYHWYGRNDDFNSDYRHTVGQSVCRKNKKDYLKCFPVFLNMRAKSSWHNMSLYCDIEEKTTQLSVLGIFWLR